MLISHQVYYYCVMFFSVHVSCHDRQIARQMDRQRDLNIKEGKCTTLFKESVMVPIFIFAISYEHSIV